MEIATADWEIPAEGSLALGRLPLPFAWREARSPKGRTSRPRVRPPLQGGKGEARGLSKLSQAELRFVTEERRRLGAFSQFPRDLDAKAAAAVWELDHRRCSRATLESWCRSVLFNGRKQKNDTDLHDLRVFRGRTDHNRRNGQRASGGMQSISWRFFVQPIYSIRKVANTELGLSLFDREWSNIRAGQAWAATQFTRTERRPISAVVIRMQGLYCSISASIPEKDPMERARTCGRAILRRSSRRRSSPRQPGHRLRALGETRRAIGFTSRPHHRSRDRRPARRRQRPATWASPTQISAKPGMPSTFTNSSSRSFARSATARRRQCPRQPGPRLGGSGRDPERHRGFTNSISPSPARSATGAEKATLSATWASPTRSRRDPARHRALRTAACHRPRDRRPARRRQRPRQPGHRLGGISARPGAPSRLTNRTRDRPRDRRPARRRHTSWNLGWLWRKRRPRPGVPT